ncbi:unnamed protein product, partial [Meganyctiphanes norvegica]
MYFCVVLITTLLSVTPSESNFLQSVANKQSKPPSIKDIEDFVKQLEYETLNGLDDTLSLVPVDLNLLDDELISDNILQGLQEEFQQAGKFEIGEVKNETANKSNQKHQIRKEPLIRARQLSLIYQGVYAPDARFNAFVDGVMVNMVADMRRKRMDPLYFRVYDRGIIEHVSTRSGRKNDQAGEKQQSESNRRTSRQSGDNGSAIGGGVIRGLTSIKRFGNAEVQLAGNVTLVRSHFVFGPLNIELIFQTLHGPKSINSTLTAVAGHAVTQITNSTSRLSDFIIDSPANHDIRLLGDKSELHRRISTNAILRVFKPTGKLERRLNNTWTKVASKRVPKQFLKI